MLIVDIPRLSLRQGDRLEPRKGLQDTWLFDAIGIFRARFSFGARAMKPAPGTACHFSIRLWASL